MNTASFFLFKLFVDTQFLSVCKLVPPFQVPSPKKTDDP